MYPDTGPDIMSAPTPEQMACECALACMPFYKEIKEFKRIIYTLSQKAAARERAIIPFSECYWWPARALQSCLQLSGWPMHV